MLPKIVLTAHCRARGFTIMEVLIAALLISMVIGSIMAMNAQAIHTLYATRQAAASSQILQQRVEMIRARPWPEIASSTALAQLMETPTESEKELADTGMTESLEISVPALSETGVMEATSSFRLQRKDGGSTILTAGDFTAEPTLLVESSIIWRDVNGVHRRLLRTIVCRAGLTRSGVFGSPLGRPPPVR